VNTAARVTAATARDGIRRERIDRRRLGEIGMDILLAH
jgi:hypothetical protein